MTRSLTIAALAAALLAGGISAASARYGSGGGARMDQNFPGYDRALRESRDAYRAQYLQTPSAAPVRKAKKKRRHHHR